MPVILVFKYVLYDMARWEEDSTILWIADKAYDSDKLRKNPKAIRIDLIVPHRRNRKKKRFQDYSKLRRYKKGG